MLLFSVPALWEVTKWIAGEFRGKQFKQTIKGSQWCKTLARASSLIWHIWHDTTRYLGFPTLVFPPSNFSISTFHFMFLREKVMTFKGHTYTESPMFCFWEVGCYFIVWLSFVSVIILFSPSLVLREYQGTRTIRWSDRSLNLTKQPSIPCFDLK